MRRTLAISILAVAAWLPSTSTATPTVPNAAVAPAPFVSFDGRHFLEYDTTGDGRAVEVVGDLATATHIAIIIPGVGTALANFDHGLGNVERRAPAFQARQLYRQMADLAPDEPVAAVAWLGYDTPEGLGMAAVREDRAAAGATALVSFVDTLAADHPSATITVVGHSYGSVVAGLAAPRLNGAVHDIIAIGSPGMGVDHAADLHTTARVWAGTASSDWTKWIPGIRVLGLGHGTRPATPGFGALPLPVSGVQGHDGYFVAGVPTLRAMAEIALDGRLGGRLPT
jgi:pimeloyl-ACP methyl ester carboxylesterase